MARCGCEQECLCVLIEGDCITVAGSGNVASPYLISAEVDPDVDNQLVCNEDGLFVEPAIFTTDTDCVDLEGDGTVGAPLTADLIVDPDADNLSECGANGLTTLLNTADTDCIDLEGAGTAGDPLTAAPIISADGGNVLECRPNGMFSPATANGPIDHFAIIHNAGGCPNVVPPSIPGTFTSVFIDYDTVEVAAGLLAFPCGGPFYTHTYVEVPVGGDGWYLIQATHPGWEGPPFDAGNAIFRLELWLNGDGIGQSGQNRVDTTSGAPGYYISPYMHVSRTIYLSAGDRVHVGFSQQSALASGGAVLSVLPIYGFTLPFRAGYPFFSAVRIGV